jgi:hypothetical protein
MLIYEPAVAVGLDGLEDELARAFTSIRAALEEGDAVVVSLDDRDVAGTGDVARAALAHGLIGLTRALALEGAKPGWRIAALSSTADVAPRERQRWIDHLSESSAASGTLMRLGGAHLGKVPA